MKEYLYFYHSIIGKLTLASDGASITGLWIDGQKYDRLTLSADAEEIGERAESIPVFGLAARWLDLYFSGRKPDFGVPLAPKGSAFRREVWRLLTRIPYGQTATYGELAKKMAAFCNRETMSAQAVGGAVGHNPISILIPCHRVLGADGSLTGYAAGTEIKKYLLRLEGSRYRESRQASQRPEAPQGSTRLFDVTGSPTSCASTCPPNRASSVESI